MATGVRIWGSLALLLAFAVAAFGQLPVRRIRAKMTDSLTNTPDFVCAVSFESSEHLGKSATVTLPPLSVNGGVINGKELYAWPANEEDQTRLRAVLAVFGKAGSGSFALY